MKNINDTVKYKSEELQTTKKIVFRLNWSGSENQTENDSDQKNTKKKGYATLIN